MQYLSTDNMALLTSAHQKTQNKYYQGFSQVVPANPWVKVVIEVGDIVVGATSHAAGTVYAINYTGTRYFRTNSISNTVYSDGENLTVNGIIYGVAYGSTLDETGVVVPIRPEDWILRLLGGQYWSTITGVEPYRIASTTGYYGTGQEKPEIDFIFDEKTTKIQAIQKVCEYLEFVFFVKPRIIGTFVPNTINASSQSAYFTKESKIDEPPSKYGAIGSGYGHGLGANYHIDDVLRITQDNAIGVAATIEVQNVDGITGMVTEYKLLTTGSGYLANTGGAAHATTGGSGTGFTYKVTSIFSWGLDLPYPYIYSQNFALLTPESATLIRVGDVVKGATSGAIGVVYSVSYITNNFHVQSSTNTPYQIEENLQVDGVTLVTANGNSVDETLDPPSPWTITKPDRYLVSPVERISKGEEKYNRITVRCHSFAGVWYQSIQQTPGVTSGDELPIEYYEVNPDLSTQAEADDRALDLYTYYSAQIDTWKATFNLRSDFRLLQRLVFNGYTDEIPNNTYRIIGIEYNTANGGIVNQVICTLISNSQFKAYLNLNRVFTDGIKEAQIIARDEIAKAGTNEVGTVLSIGANGEIVTPVLYVSGSGYHIDDVITIVQSGASGGTLKVTGLVGSGSSIDSFILLTIGSGYAVATNLSTTASPSGGTGCKIRITEIANNLGTCLVETDAGQVKIVRDPT
jgi:hypothetical protein